MSDIRKYLKEVKDQDRKSKKTLGNDPDKPHLLDRILLGNKKAKELEDKAHEKKAKKNKIESEKYKKKETEKAFSKVPQKYKDKLEASKKRKAEREKKKKK